MTRRKPRAAPRTVDRWLREGIPPRTWEKLVDELAPSIGTAARWRREGVIPEARLREIKAPAPKRPARRVEPPRPPPRPAPRQPPKVARVVERWIDSGIPENVFDRVVAELAPDDDVAAEWREREEIPVARLRRLKEIPKPKRPRPERFVPPPQAVLTAEQIGGMRKLGLSEAQIATAGRPETTEERDARLEREAIQEVETPELRTPREIELARENARLRSELERAHRAIEGPPPELPPEQGEAPAVKFKFDKEPRAHESDDAWLERVGEQIIAEMRLTRPDEDPNARAERLIGMVRRNIDRPDGEVLMDIIADVLTAESGMSIRDVYEMFFSPKGMGS